MTEREPNIFDKLANLIPGYTSFKEKESRRDADKSLRDHVASRLDGTKRHIDELVLELTDEGKLDTLDHADRLKRRIGICADTIRHAQYGESGFMDDKIIGETELSRVYEHDLALLDQAKRVVKEVSRLSVDNFAESVRDVRATADDLLKAIEQRDELFQEVF